MEIASFCDPLVEPAAGPLIAWKMIEPMAWKIIEPTE
jgi:hypothetical protein